MTPQHTARRWLIGCLGVLLGAICMNAAAIDPGTVKGNFAYGGKTHLLKHVYAWQPPGKTDELWVYLTDTELPPAAKDHSKPADFAKDSSFRGVKLKLNPARSDLGKLSFVRFSSADDGMNVNASDSKIWQQLRVANNRVLGKLQYTSDNGWSLDAEFNAPVAAPSSSSTTLTGAQAQKSPQVEVVLAFEKALYSQGVDAASAYMTAEALAGTKDQIRQMGADAFKGALAKMRESTPQGEARRQQIEKVVVDGDFAKVVDAGGKRSRSLVKTNDGWKIAP